MRPATAKDIPREQRLFTEVWELLKKYYFIGPDDHTGWEALNADMRTIAGKYKDTDLKYLAADLLCDAASYLEKKSRTRG